MDIIVSSSYVSKIRYVVFPNTSTYDAKVYLLH